MKTKHRSQKRRIGLEAGPSGKRAQPGVRSLATLENILRATRKLLADRDYATLSMRSLAAEAGVTAGAIYKHFPGKQALVDHVLQASLREFELELLQALRPLPPGSFERIIALGEAYIRFALERTEQYKILFMPRRPRPVRLDSLPGEAGFKLLRQCVAEAMQAGAIRRGDPDMAAFFLWSRVHGIVLLWMACDFNGCLPLKDEEMTPAKLFELSRVFMWEGFKPSGAGAKDDS